MSVLDIALIGFGCFFIIKGLLSGFTGEIISLISVIGGFYCSMRFSAPASDVIASTFGVSSFASRASSMVAIFLAVFIVCAIVKRLMKRAIKETRLTFVDKALGAFAGFVKIYLIALAVMLAGMIVSPVTGDAWVRESRVLVAAAKTWPHVSPVLDSLGLLPDLAKVQESAREHIARTASNALFGSGESANEDIESLASPEANVEEQPSEEAQTEQEKESSGLLDRVLSIFR